MAIFRNNATGVPPNVRATILLFLYYAVLFVAVPRLAVPVGVGRNIAAAATTVKFRNGRPRPRHRHRHRHRSLQLEIGSEETLPSSFDIPPSDDEVMAPSKKEKGPSKKNKGASKKKSPKKKSKKKSPKKSKMDDPTVLTRDDFELDNHSGLRGVLHLSQLEWIGHGLGVLYGIWLLFTGGCVSHSRNGGGNAKVIVAFLAVLLFVVLLPNLGLARVMSVATVVELGSLVYFCRSYEASDSLVKTATRTRTSGATVTNTSASSTETSALVVVPTPGVKSSPSSSPLALQVAKRRREYFGRTQICRAARALVCTASTYFLWIILLSPPEE